MSSPTAQPASHYDVVVVGAGQAGLAVGYFLARQGNQYVILEAGSQLGSAWRSRWDSLSSLPRDGIAACRGCRSPVTRRGTPAEMRLRIIWSGMRKSSRSRSS